MIRALGILFFIGLLMGCQKSYQPKPRGYNRLDLPEPQYQSSPDTLPYRFDYSTHAKLLPDSSGLTERYWTMIYYPELKANIHITFKRIGNSEDRLKEYLDDAYTLTAKHQIKAYAIDETIAQTPGGKTAVIAEIEGDVPSQFQFTMTDSSENFLRGALYFDTEVKNDSLMPAIEYVKKDVMVMINSLEWNESIK